MKTAQSIELNEIDDLRTALVSGSLALGSAWPAWPALPSCTSSFSLKRFRPLQLLGFFPSFYTFHSPEARF